MKDLKQLSDADLMKHVRSQLGLTQSEMAACVGYARAKDISNVERGAKNMSGPARHHLLNIARWELS